ncbi:ABC transporter substrate-binding protein [Candidatus Poribacteria bacterium]|nr:ABC transporter substrate-binding protein [Candidatus Poribacteria bacterium]
MLIQQFRNRIHYISVNSTFIFMFLMSITLIGCERIQQVVSPDDLGATVSDTVKIGFIYSSPDPGTTRNGAELAVTVANKNEGINGTPIELIIKDDNKDVELSVKHVESLIREGVLAIVGPDYSDIALEVGKVTQENKIPMVTTYPTNPNVTKGRDYTFMGGFIDPFQAKVIASFAIKELSAKNSAVLTETGNTYSEGLSNVFIETFLSQGGTVATHQFYETGTTDFTEQLMYIDAVDPAVDIIFLPGLGSEFPLAVKQAKSTDFSISATFLGGDGWDRPDLVEIGGTAVEGSFFTNHFSPGSQLSELGQQFVDAYIELYNIPPDGPAALGYDAMTIVIEAIRRTNDNDTEAIRDEIMATQDYDGATQISRFDENRHAIKSLVVNTVKNGEIQAHRFLQHDE